MTTSLPEKDHKEVVPILFDFTDEIGAATITGTPVVDVDVKTGNAFAPAGIKQGTATVNGAVVTQWVNAATLPGVTYHLRCRAALSDTRVLVISADLPVVKA